MIAFVAFAAMMTVVAIGAILLGGRSRIGRASFADENVAVLRQQRQELEHERAALAASEYEALRDDLRQRLLTEAKPARARPAARASRWPLLATAASVPVLAAALYAAVGSPEAIGRAGAPTLAQLESRLAESPGDARAWVLLARLRMQADRFDAAAHAYGKAIEISPRKVAIDPQVWAEYADALAMSQGGTLAGKPREAIDRALGLDPNHPQALELAGSAAVEARNYGAARAHWSALLSQLPEGSAQRAPLRAALQRINALAGMPPAAN